MKAVADYVMLAVGAAKLELSCPDDGLKETLTMFERRFIYIFLRSFLVLQTSCSVTTCQAANCITDAGGALFEGMCYVIALNGVSCTDKCIAEGGICNEAALELSTAGCSDVLVALDVTIQAPTSSWASNFGPTSSTSSTAWISSIFDENYVRWGAPEDAFAFHTMGCVVSPKFDATDQTSATTENENSLFSRPHADAAEAHYFDQAQPTCEGAVGLYRRICSCTFSTPSPMTTPTPAPSPVPPHAPIDSPTPAPIPFPLPFPTPSPTRPPTHIPAQVPATSPTPAPTVGQTPVLVTPGYWRTSEASDDVRSCPLPDLCQGGSGGGDDICLGDNVGPYCLVCPSSHFSSVKGVCLACGSSGVSTFQLLGIVSAACLLLSAVSFVGPVGEKADKAETFFRGKSGVVVTHDSIFAKLWEKLFDLQTLVGCIRNDLPDTIPAQAIVQVQDLVVTIDMFMTRLLRLLPSVPSLEPGLAMQKALVNAELLCPIIDQLASAVSGLSGVASGEVMTVVLHTRSVLATARALDPCAHLRKLPWNDAASIVKTVLSFAQAVAASPLLLVVRHPGRLRTFLEGLSMVNFSLPKALSIPCLVNGNFHGELLFKTVGPLAMGVIIASTGALKRLRSTITGRTESSSRLIRSQILLALTYFVLIPATNAVLRAFPCEAFDDGSVKLRADYSIDCDAQERVKYRVLATAMAIVYPVGSLAVYSSLLWRHRQQLHPPHVRRRSRDDKEIAQEAKRINEGVLRPLALLHDAYEPSAWWYEVFETIRRIVLAALVYLATMPRTQLWIAIGGTVLALVMNAVFGPFVEKVDDRLYSGANCVILAVFGLALTVDTEDGDGDGDERTAQWLGSAALVLIVGYISVALFALAVKWQGRRKFRTRTHPRLKHHDREMHTGKDDQVGQAARVLASQERGEPHEALSRPTTMTSDDVSGVTSSAPPGGIDAEAVERAIFASAQRAHRGAAGGLFSQEMKTDLPNFIPARRRRRPGQPEATSNESRSEAPTFTGSGGRRRSTYIKRDRTARQIGMARKRASAIAPTERESAPPAGTTDEETDNLIKGHEGNPWSMARPPSLIPNSEPDQHQVAADIGTLHDLGAEKSAA